MDSHAPPRENRLNLIEPMAVASFGAGAAGAAAVLLGAGSPLVGAAALSGGTVAVLVFAKASGALSVTARRAGLVFAALVFLGVAGCVASLRSPALGSLGGLALEAAKVLGWMLAGGAGVTAAAFALVAGAGSLLSRRPRFPRVGPDA